MLGQRPNSTLPAHLLPIPPLVRCPAALCAAEHGPSACGMGWRVRDAAKAYDEAVARGAEPVEVNPGPMELRLPAIRGIGGSIIYLIDRNEGKNAEGGQNGRANV